MVEIKQGVKHIGMSAYIYIYIIPQQLSWKVHFGGQGPNPFYRTFINKHQCILDFVEEQPFTAASSSFLTYEMYTP